MGRGRGADNPRRSRIAIITRRDGIAGTETAFCPPYAGGRRERKECSGYRGGRACAAARDGGGRSDGRLACRFRSATGEPPVATVKGCLAVEERLAEALRLEQRRDAVQALRRAEQQPAVVGEQGVELLVQPPPRV